MTDAFIHISGSGKKMCEALGLPEEMPPVPTARDAQCQLVEWLIDHDDALWALEHGIADVHRFVEAFSGAAIADYDKLKGRVKTLEDAPKPEALAPALVQVPAQHTPEWVTRFSESDIVALRRDCNETDSQVKATIMAHGALDNRVHALETAPKLTETSHKPLWYVIIGLVLTHAATVAYLALHH